MDSNVNDHCVQLYQELERLTDSVAEYIVAGLARGEAVLVIATPAHRAALLGKLDVQSNLEQGQLKLLDAEETLACFMTNGMPQWNAFHETVGGRIAELRLQYPAVRAYGEMVDMLWQKGEREAAIRLEEYWNELGTLQTFALFCAYRMDPLDSDAYGGPLESVCKLHTRLVPTHDQARFDEAVNAAAAKILDGPLAQILLSLSANHRPVTRMPAGQATLLWLRHNMPRTAEKVLSELRGAVSTAAR